MTPNYGQFPDLLVEKRDGIAVVTMNRPDRLNSNPEMQGQLENVWPELTADEGVRVAVLTGAGKAFSAGGDVKTMRDAAARGIDAVTVRRLIMTTQRLVNNMLDFPKPLIAAVNGPAVGLGATIALFCDIVIAKEGALIGDTHVKVGIAAGDGGCVIWPHLVGMSKAKQYLFTGDLIEAREAERIGLISQAVAPDAFMPAVMALAEKLAQGAPMAISHTKMALNKILRQRMVEVLDTSIALEVLNMFSKDHAEAAEAFLERRQPNFKGH